MSDADERFLSLLARLDLLPAESVAELKALQLKRREVGESPRLEVLVEERGLLTVDQWDLVFRWRVYEKIREEDLDYAETARSRGLVPEAELQRCLLEQEGAFHAGGKVPRLGELLVLGGILNVEQDDAITAIVEQQRESPCVPPAPPATSAVPAQARPAAPRRSRVRVTVEVPRSGPSPSPAKASSSPSQAQAAAPPGVPGPGSEGAAAKAFEGGDSGGTTGGWVFGKICVEKGWTTQERINECLKEQLILSAEGRSRLLGELLVAKGYLEEVRVKEVLAIQAWRERTRGDRQYGKLALANRFISQEQLDSALGEQRRVRQMGRKAPPIGEILLARGAIFYLEHLAVLKLQERLSRKDREEDE